MRQCQILSLSRSTTYYRPPETSEANLTLMRRISINEVILVALDEGTDELGIDELTSWPNKARWRAMWCTPAQASITTYKADQFDFLHEGLCFRERKTSYKRNRS